MNCHHCILVLLEHAVSVFLAHVLVKDFVERGGFDGIKKFSELLLFLGQSSPEPMSGSIVGSDGANGENGEHADDEDDEDEVL